MNKKKHLIILFLLINLLGCESTNNSKIVRGDLFDSIKGFIEFSEKETKSGKDDTNIYWVQFFEKNGDDLVVIMQQPYYDSVDTDGFLEIDENMVFFYYSDSSIIKTNKLKQNIPANIPDEKSKESNLGYSAPNWAYTITKSGLKKTFIGE